MSSEDLAAWLREQVQARLELARKATPGPWAWEPTGDKDNSWAAGLVQDETGDSLHGEIEPGQGVVIDGVCESINGHLPDAAHIAANDPRDVIARCEAELAILDLYERTAAIAQIPPAISQGQAAREIRARDCLDAMRELAALEGVVRLLGTGYRHADGYREQWAP